MSVNSVTPGLTVQRSGPFLLLSGPTDLLGHLRVARVESADEDSTDLVRRELALFGFADELVGRSRPVVWAGLEPAVRGLFKSHGIPLSVAPAPTVTASRGTGGTGRASTAGAANGTSANGAGTAANGKNTLDEANTGTAISITDPAVVSFASGVPRGLIRYGPSVDVLLLIAALCLTFTTEKVVVIVRTRAAAGRLHRLLRDLGVEAVLITGKHHGEPRRVTVCTLGTSGRAGIERADVILVEDALHSTWVDPLVEPLIEHDIFLRNHPRNSAARDPRMPPAVGLMDRLRLTKTSAKVIGFVSQGRPLSPFEQARVWQIYGFAELVVPRHGAVERPVVAAMANRVNLRRSILAGADEVGAKKAVWHDGARNRLRAKLAAKLAEGNEMMLRIWFSTVATALPDFAPKAALLLCEGLDQAQAIRKLFRDVPLVTDCDDAACDVEAALANPVGGVVATALGAAKLPGGLFDVVVRCDPGRGLPPLPRGWLETNESNPRPLVVADVDDQGHHLPALWTRMRKRAYLAAGWARAGADPDETAWARFDALVLNREERP